MAANVRWKKTRSPGYKPGDNWADCDRCGCTIRASEGKMTWDGLFVCPDDWEPRHPQDFVRAKPERITPVNPVRTEGPFALVQREGQLPSEGISAIAGIAVAGISIAGLVVTPSEGYTTEVEIDDEVTYTIQTPSGTITRTLPTSPAGTFNNDL